MTRSEREVLTHAVATALDRALQAERVQASLLRKVEALRVELVHAGALLGRALVSVGDAELRLEIKAALRGRTTC